MHTLSMTYRYNFLNVDGKYFGLKFFKNFDSSKLSKLHNYSSQYVNSYLSVDSSPSHPGVNIVVTIDREYLKHWNHQPEFKKPYPDWPCLLKDRVQDLGESHLLETRSVFLGRSKMITTCWEVPISLQKINIIYSPQKYMELNEEYKTFCGVRVCPFSPLVCQISSNQKARNYSIIL